MVAEFALAVVQEALERLDSCQNGDYSGILLRVECLNRTIINCGHSLDQQSLKRERKFRSRVKNFHDRLCNLTKRVENTWRATSNKRVEFKS